MTEAAQNKEFAIVAIGYNRPKSMERLLGSLLQADYLNDRVDLVISIDYSGNDSVYNVAVNFEWPYGEKKIIKHTENLGLKRHVLYCGGLTAEYENICVFEDDIYVSPAFYNFAKQATAFYKDDDNIAGISLYTHLWNQMANRSFMAIADCSDAYFLQQAQSWGQVWSKTKWNEFFKWYTENSVIDLLHINFPSAISDWSESSWLKYHMKYLLETNKYFVYPFQSLSTNFYDVGTHATSVSTGYQVPLQISLKKKYIFPTFEGVEFKYDIYFENTELCKYLNINGDDLTVDLYGIKKQFNRYLLTSKNLNFKIKASYALQLRPHELNVIFNIRGNDFFLYDTNEVSYNPINKYLELNKFLYDVRTNSRKDLLVAGIYFYIQALKLRLNKIWRKIK